MSYETTCQGYWFHKLLTDYVAVTAEKANNMPGFSGPCPEF